jgi:hypothetical protein
VLARNVRSPLAHQDDPVRVSFPKGAWMALALFAVLMLGGLYAQLGVVEDQRRTNRNQRALIRVSPRACPTLVEWQV